MLAMLLLVIAGATLLTSQLDARTFKAQQHTASLNYLANAKRALLARAATDTNRPGSLPCPDSDGDGLADIFFGTDCPRYIGRLPWKSLGMSAPSDDSQQDLWYALSPSFRDHPSAEPVNPFSTSPDLTINNPGGPGTVVAVVIAPGAPVCAQNRVANNVNLPDHYLELDNNDLDNDFQSQASDGNFGCEADLFNDMLVTIAPDDIQAGVRSRFERIAFESAATLKRYFADCGYLPWAMTFQNPATVASFVSQPGQKQGFFPADTATPTDWGSGCAPQFIRLRQNNWYASLPGLLVDDPIYYMFGLDYQLSVNGQCALGSNCLSVHNLVTGDNDPRVPAIVLHAGSPIGSQSRPSAMIEDYYEYNNAIISNTVFEIRANAADFNDEIIRIP